MYFELCLVFVLSIVFIQLLKRYAHFLSLIDIPNHRSEHKQNTPNAGGIGIIVSVFLILSIFHFDFFKEYIYSLFAIAVVWMVGILDDRVGMSPTNKFVAIAAANIFLYLDDIVIKDLGVYFGVYIYLVILSLPFSVFAVSGFTNALNLIDGLDGLSTIISIICLIVFAFVGYIYQDNFIFYISVYFLSALFAFLIFNWYPASIFMGDSGALSLGFIISALAIKSLDYISASSILFFTAIPIFDTLIVMIRRKKENRPIFTSDRCHIHHIFKRFFHNNIKKTVLFIAILQLFYTTLGVFINTLEDNAVGIILFISNIFILYLVLDLILKKQNGKCK